MSDQAAKLDTQAKYPVRIGVGQALYELVRYISPRGNREVMTRTLLALLFIAIARASTLIVPIAYGWVVDFVSDDPFQFDISVMWWLLGAYALARISQQFFDEEVNMSLWVA